MTTEKLIEIAKICSYKDRCTMDCPYVDNKSTDCAEKLLRDVTFRLEKVYADLKEQCSCETCKYNDICEQGGDDIPICTNGNMRKWEGDSE